MHRILQRVLTIFLTMLIFALPNVSYAAGTVSVTGFEYGPYLRVLVFTCVGDASGGTIPDTSTDDELLLTGSLPVDFVGWTATDFIKGRYLDKVEINPGATAPTADSDVYFLNAAGIDILDGNGVDKLSDTTSLGCVPGTDSQNKQQPIDGPITLDVDGQLVNSATYVIKAFFDR